MGKIGASGKFTPEIEQAICEGIRLGVSRSAAANLVGISKMTISKWLNPESDVYKVTLFTAVTRAEAEYQKSLIIKVRQAAEAGTQQKRIETTTKLHRRVTRHPDGTVVEDWIPYEEKSETVIVGEHDWRAAAWALERRFKEDFGAAVDITSGNEKVPVFGYVVNLPAIAKEEAS